MLNVYTYGLMMLGVYTIGLVEQFHLILYTTQTVHLVFPAGRSWFSNNFCINVLVIRRSHYCQIIIFHSILPLTHHVWPYYLLFIYKLSGGGAGTAATRGGRQRGESNNARRVTTWGGRRGEGKKRSRQTAAGQVYVGFN